MRKALLLFCAGLFCVGTGPLTAPAQAKRPKVVRLSHKLKSGQTVRASFILPRGWRVSGKADGQVTLVPARNDSQAEATVGILEDKNVIKAAFGFGTSFAQMGCQAKVTVEEAVARQGITKATVKADCGPQSNAMVMLRAFPGRKKVILVGMVIIPGPMTQGDSLMKSWGRARLR